jgi:DNA-binding HxlR family transcriptional regulator
MQCESKPGCVKAALEIIGDKWSPLLLKELAEHDARRFSDLSTALPGLSPRTLSQRLEHLEQENVIVKNQYCERPVRFEYALTQKGQDLVSVIVAMGKWGEKYAPSPSRSVA